MTFQEECNQWLNPKGFYISSYSGDEKLFNFTYKEPGLNMPTIICYINKDTDEKRVKLLGGIYKMLAHLVVEGLSFKHPDIDKFISTMQHYDNLIEHNPPF